MRVFFALLVSMFLALPLGCGGPAENPNPSPQPDISDEGLETAMPMDPSETPAGESTE
jgi:hypothetical protein